MITTGDLPTVHVDPAQLVLVFQNLLGVIPTLLAIGGWLVVLVRSLRRRDAAGLLVGLLPLAGIAGYLLARKASRATKDEPAGVIGPDATEIPVSAVKEIRQTPAVAAVASHHDTMPSTARSMPSAARSTFVAEYAACPVGLVPS